MGGISTSHSASLSNHKASASKEFDLRNWRGLTDLLRVGRESIPDPRAYAEFRNLVLGYAQRGGDAEIRRNIDTIVATFSKNKVTSEPTEKVIAVKRDIPVVQPVPTPTPVHEEKQVIIEPEKVAEPIPVVVHNAPRPSLGIPTRRMQPRFDIAPKQTFIPKELSEVAVPIPPQTSGVASSSDIEEIDTTSDVLETDAEAKTPQTQEEYKARITEIKHLVHEKVGNPVALMGTHNAHGKKYMTALLSALKSTTAGSLDEMHDAVVTLEQVAKALLEDAPLDTEVVSESKESRIEPEAPVVTEEKIVVPVPPQKVVIQETVIPDEEPVRHFSPREIIDEPPAETVQHIKEETVVHTQRSVIEEKSEDVPEPIILKEEGRVPLHKYSVSEIMAEKKTHESEEVRHEEQTHVHEEDERWNDEAVREESVITTSVVGNETPHPRTKHVYKAISTSDPEVIKEVIGIDTQKVTEEQTELYSQKITEALQQLLHEWSIFGGSGLFGIGPGGSEHPLYIKLSLLSMGELLAGRWDKADPKLIKVIKQYVDAWRHEQGIAYTIDETFEHYLRRVVQKILKRQGS